MVCVHLCQHGRFFQHLFQLLPQNGPVFGELVTLRNHLDHLQSTVIIREVKVDLLRFLILQIVGIELSLSPFHPVRIILEGVQWIEPFHGDVRCVGDDVLFFDDEVAGHGEVVVDYYDFTLH